MANIDDFNADRGVQPRDGAWDRVAQAESERMKCDLQAQQEREKQRAQIQAYSEKQLGDPYRALGGKAPLEQMGQLNRVPALVDAAALASAIGALSREVEAMAIRIGRIDELVRSLLDSRSPFTDDDVAAIKAHVRHPGALEAARLRETIRCALVALKVDGRAVAGEILGGLDAKG